MTEQEKALNELISYRDKLEKIEYEDIKTLIRESIKFIPVTTAKLKKGEFIDRVRLNKKTDFFKSQSEISYVKDQFVIDNYLTEFGRANRPKEPLFYGALRSTQIEHNRLTGYLETSEMIHDKESVNLNGELFTVTRWEVKNELIIAEIVFSDDALKSNPDTRHSFENQFKQLNQSEHREIALRQLQLFSNEFSRKTNSHHDYKISVAYSDLLLNEYGIDGITFPSVKSEYQGQNIVFKPEAVDKHLELKIASTHRMHKNKMESFMSNYHHTTDFGKNNSNFVWDLTKINEKQIIEESIKQVTKK
ncbi:hypothetical protein [Polaribacter sp. IC073]|uniref:hypothetical protein n=1 Tax=Polaribacter sp. IC073 TaxID=2508540 RepID=UPI0011BDAA05|nr:hypothetical protein [Polaribacter sp. IC073]TXD45755.1 hypothetical protein ES045_16125 [Polaribacter sp. IC073]